MCDTVSANNVACWVTSCIERTLITSEIKFTIACVLVYFEKSHSLCNISNSRDWTALYSLQWLQNSPSSPVRIFSIKKLVHINSSWAKSPWRSLQNTAQYFVHWPNYCWPYNGNNYLYLKDKKIQNKTKQNRKTLKQMYFYSSRFLNSNNSVIR